MAGLRASWLPWPRFDYREALWRVGVAWEGAPVWFARACDLDATLIRTLGGW